jgi:hypothetical protein
MCHRLDLDGRLQADHVAALLSTHRLDDDGEGSLNRQRIVEVLSSDWGFYTTATDNLDNIPRLVAEVDPELGPAVAAAAAEIRDEVERAPKSRSFKLRARVGRRKRWYELPDESIT